MMTLPQAGPEALVDIIVPIHNALDVLRPCLASVRQHTQDVPYRLILINDASSEPEIASFCRESLRPGDLYLEHAENLGFVKSVNQGMAVSETHDVLLLNSDTRVAPGWLSRLRQAVLQHPQIAGAIPLSNYASIYSVRALAEFKTEEDLELIASALADFDGQKNMPIPTAVGFCFYIRRQALKKTGSFDERFGIGYGEENDFCMRAIKKGWRFVLAPSAYVYHEGHVSMRRAGHLKENQNCLPANEALLLRRHPDYTRRIQSFLDSHSMDALRPRVLQRISSRLAGARHRILYLVHNAINGKHIGGTEFHVRDLIRELRGRYACYTAHIRQGNVIVEEHVGAIGTSYVFPLECDPGRFPLHSQIVHNAVRRILQLFAIELVHVHHLLGWGVDAVHAAKDLNLPVLMTIHDFYALSPDHGLTHRGTQKYRSNFLDYEQIHLASAGFTHFSSQAWKDAMAPMLARIDQLFFPSHFSREVLAAEYSLPVRQTVREHGYDVSLVPDSAPALPPARFLVCFIGGIHQERKGRYIIEEILRQAGDDIDFHLVGTSAEYWPSLKAKNVQIHGFYERSQIVSFLKELNPHVAGLVSLIGETYGYTLTESWAAGIPVIAGPPQGVLAERIQHTGAGIVLAELTAHHFLAAIRQLQGHPEEYQTLRESVKKIRFKKLAENVREYEQDYRFRLPEFSPAPAACFHSTLSVKEQAHEAWLTLPQTLQKTPLPPDAAARNGAPGLKTPLFVVGMAKSGTSYLRNILNGHPEIFIEMECLNRFWEDFVREKNLADTEAMKKQYAGFWNQVCLRFPQKKFIGDKICFGDTSYMRAWAELFLIRHSKIIVLTRDPRDRLVSLRYHFTNRSPGHHSRWFYHPEWHYQDVDAAWWKTWLPQFEQAGALILSYDDLYQKPVQTTRRILDYLNLRAGPLQAAQMVRRAQNPANLSFHINPVRNGKPGAWKKKLLPDECIRFKPLAIIPWRSFSKQRPDWEFETLEMLRVHFTARLLFLRFKKLRSTQFWRWARRNRSKHAWLARWWGKILDYEDPLMSKDYYPLRSLPLPLNSIRYLLKLRQQNRTGILNSILTAGIETLFSWARKTHRVAQDFSSTKLKLE